MDCKHENAYLKSLSWSLQKQKTTVKYRCQDCNAGATKTVNHVIQSVKVYGDKMVYVKGKDNG